MNTQVEYKFFINGTTWVPDPNNPTTGTDMNSVLAPIDCDPATKICGTSPVLGYDWRDAVMYFVFVDRFKDGDPTNNAPISGVETPANYQGGDYQGVIDKLNDGYFSDLGVNTLWITVPLDNTEQTGLGISENGTPRQYSAYHGYWVSKNDQVEEHFGTMDKLKELVSTAHSKGIKILIDYPMNHVHKSAPVYTQHPEWFWPLDYNGGKCTCGGSAVCSYDDPNTTTRCWFTDYLPDFNYTIQEARDYTTDNAVWWLQQIGADGYRLDAIKHVEKSWVVDMRAKAKAQLESVTQQTVYMVGETFDEGNPGKLREYVSSTMLHGQFDFPQRRVIEDKILRRTGSMVDLDNFLNVNDGYYGPNAIMSTFMGNHDISRIIHKAEDNPWEPNDWTDLPSIPTSANPFQRVAVGFTLLFTTKGIPLVYYGDEVGMPGGRDPDNRRPMQWTNYTNNQSALKAHIAKLGAIRAAHPALRKGTRTKITATQDTYLYKMELTDDLVVVALNRADSGNTIEGLPAGNWKDLLTDAPVSGTISLPARSSMVLVKQ
ncbi:MAG: alpha-amylase family glycosyl hydrolase [Polyangiaceae bacterium]